MANIYSVNPGEAVNGTSIDVDRRIFNFGERVAELAPQQSPFFTYLSNVAKKPTDDPVFKFLEQRHQWQRRNFQLQAAKEVGAYSSDAYAIINADDFFVDCEYDKFGREVAVNVAPEFLLSGQIVAIECEYDADGSDGSDVPAIAYYKIDTADAVDAAKAKITAATFLKLKLKATRTADGADAATSGFQTPAANSKLRFDDNVKGQVVGSAFAEGGTDPDGWSDEFYNREGYCQIFKTSVPLFSGTALATRYRGISNEYMRVYQEKLMEHKMDLEHAMLFGIGTDSNVSGATGPIRRTWGIVPYTEAYGKIKTFAYASATYDHFIDSMEDVFSPESGNSGEKLVLASRKVLSWLNKLGGSSFLGNTMALGHTATTSGGSNPYGLDVQNVQGSFGHAVTRVSTIYGNLNFVMEPLFRGIHENTAIMIDLNNVAYRPLMGNGVSRDTQIITNVQNRNVDGRKDMVLTEAGLEISLPETHTVLQFS
jgi:hypothetical protein